MKNLEGSILNLFEYILWLEHSGKLTRKEINTLIKLIGENSI